MARVSEDNTATYLLKGIPGALWDRAKAKAKEYRPPLKMRWVLIELLEKFAPAEPGENLEPYRPRPKANATDPNAEKRNQALARGRVRALANRKAKADRASDPAVLKATPEPPDLGSSF